MVAMIERLPRHQRNLALAALLLLVLWFAWSIRSVLNPLLLGYTMAAIVAPLVRRLEKRGFRHRTAVATVFVGAMGATMLVAVGLAFQVRALVVEIGGVRSVPQETAEAPAGVEVAPTDPSLVEITSPDVVDTPVPEPLPTEPAPSRLVALVDRIDAAVAANVPIVEPGALRGAWDAFVTSESESGVLQAAGQAGGRVAQGLWSAVRTALESIFGLSTLVLLVPLYAFFWMFEMDAMHAWVARHVPVRERTRTSRIATRMGEILSRFFRGRLTICLLKGAFVSLALLVCGVEYSLLLGSLAALLSLVPFIGSVVSFALGALVAIAYQETWWVGLVIAALVYGLAEMLEGYVLMPRILGDSLGLSEVAVLFAVTAGGAALGLFGVLAALPIAAAIKVMFVEYVEPALAQWADESSSNLGHPGSRG